jgi:hypothetical protein
MGKLKEVDADKGTLTLNVKDKGGKEKSKEFKVGKNTRIMVMTGKGPPKISQGKAGLKAEQFKAGATVHVRLDKEGNVLMIGIGGPSLGPPDRPPDFFGAGNFLMGKLKEVDADKGTLTLNVKDKGGKEKSKEYKVGKSTRIMVMTGKGPPKTSQGKAGLKAEQFKAGAFVHLRLDQEGNVLMIGVGGPPSGELPIGMTFSGGLIKKINADKGILTIKTMGRGESKDVDLKVGEDTRFMINTGKGIPKMLAGTKGLKELKKGLVVQIQKDPSGKVRMIMVMSIKPVLKDDEEKRKKPAKTKEATGTIKKVDAENGTLTLMVKDEDEDKETRIKVTEKTTFISGPKDDKEELTGKKGLKSDRFQKGTEVVVVINADGSAKTVTAKPKKGKLEKDD